MKVVAYFRLPKILLICSHYAETILIFDRLTVNWQKRKDKLIYFCAVYVQYFFQYRFFIKIDHRQ